MMNNEVKILEGKIELDYKWNPGNSVGRFLTGLRDNKEILGVRCTKTSKVFFPPQMWSPYAQIKMDRYIPLTGQPRLKAGSIVYKAPWNLPEGIQVPYMYAAITFPGADTEILHIVCGSLDELKSLKPEDTLSIVWKEPRTGTIRDIDHFRKS